MNKSNLIDHYSVSSINLAADCPRSWWAKYVLKLDTVSSGAASFGSQYDQMIGKRLKTICMKEEKMGAPIEDVEEAVSGYLCQPHAFLDATHSQVPIHITPNQWNVMADIRGFYAEIKKPIVGYIDLFSDKTRRIVDLKTSSAKRTNAKWAMQVLIYSLAKQANEARIHLMTRTKVGAYYDFMVPTTEANYIWAMKVFTHYANLIEGWLEEGAGDHLPQTEGYFCSWCPERLTCPTQSVLLGG